VVERERRRRPRFALNEPVSLRVRGGKAAPAQLLDLSVDGCRLQAITALRANDLAWLHFSKGQTITGTVIWTHDLFAGVAFSGELHQSIFEQLLPDVEPSHHYGRQLRDLSSRCDVLASRCYNAESSSQLRQLSADCRIEASISALIAAFDRAPPRAALHRP